MFKSFAPCTDCKSEINYIQIDNAKDIDFVGRPMNKIIEDSDIYSGTSRSL